MALLRRLRRDPSQILPPDHWQRVTCACKAPCARGMLSRDDSLPISARRAVSASAAAAAASALALDAPVNQFISNAVFQRRCTQLDAAVGGRKNSTWHGTHVLGGGLLVAAGEPQTSDL